MGPSCKVPRILTHNKDGGKSLAQKASTACLESLIGRGVYPCFLLLLLRGPQQTHWDPEPKIKAESTCQDVGLVVFLFLS